MKLSSVVLILSLILLPVIEANAQIDIEKLYDKHWRTKTYDIIKPNKTLHIYYRYEEKGSLDYSSTTAIFQRDGRTKGFNAGGWPYELNYTLLPNNQLFIDGDVKPSIITELTDNELKVEMTQPYTSLLTNNTYDIVTKITYESFDPCILYESLRSGDWDDATMWSCQKVPSSVNTVQININHEVTIPPYYMAQARKIIQIGKLRFENGAKLITSN